MRSRAICTAILVAATFAVSAGAVPGCNCDKSGQKTPGNGDMGIPAIGSITIAPADTTLDLLLGQAPPTQAFVVTYHGDNGDSDVTSSSTFALGDPTLGTMNGSTFVSGTDHGGTTTLSATYVPGNGNAQMALAMIHVRVHGSFQGPDCMGGGCTTFPPDNAPPCAQTNIAPQIFYPPSGVLLPPNMDVMAVHFTPFPGGPPALPIQEFEVTFTNANTDARVVTKCATELMDTAQPAPTSTGGCELTLDPAMWNFIAKSNRGGDAVKVSVRATTDGMCATSSTNSVNISFADKDLNGGIYYWKSTVSAAGTGGHIWAKAFGSPLPEEQITGTAGTGLGATCYGCHTLSRDGKYMTVNHDDNDSDDEYADVRSGLVDVLNKATIGAQTQAPGFQAFLNDNSLYLGTNGLPTGTSNQFFLYNGTTGAAATPATVTVGAANERPTMPDWSADGKTVYYVKPERVGTWNGGARKDDDHIFGGSIMSMSFDPATKMFGTPSPLVASAGENNYYPGLSPDGRFLVFNRVPKVTVANPIAANPDCTGTGAQVVCPNDSFSNPAARVFLLATAAGSAVIDAENLNGSPASAPVDVSNSWPRWSPFVQTYKGDKLLWVTFSSTRDYGLKVRNHKTGMFQCYPSDSLQQPGTAHGSKFLPTCQQPQIWMAAINLSHLEFNSSDPSFTAFWLPFQDVTTHNHQAQWTQTVVDQPQPDMGTCIPSGGDCTANPSACCDGICTAGGICGIP